MESLVTLFTGFGTETEGRLLEEFLRGRGCRGQATCPVGTEDLKGWLHMLTRMPLGHVCRCFHTMPC